MQQEFETASEFSVDEKCLFTCLSCHIAFHSPESQREHYRSEWHRYNLQRKVAFLPPIAFDAFQQRIDVKKKEEEDSAMNSSNCSECAVCKKTYSSENAYRNHLQSKKHLDNSQKPLILPSPPAEQNPAMLEESDEEMLPEDEIEKRIKTAVRLEESDCIFCTHASKSFEDNLEHMTRVHSFFIPDIEYLADIKGLFRYLADKVSFGYICLYCNGRGRALRSLEAVRKHMTNKGHCKIYYEDDADLEIAEFYNFASIIDDEYELVDDDASWDDAESTTDTIIGRPKPLQDTIEDSTELILANGKRLGHRAYSHIWKQHIRLPDTREVALVNNMVGRYKALGWKTALEEIKLKKKQDLLRARAHDDYKSRVGMKANGLQRYFRLQNPM